MTGNLSYLLLPGRHHLLTRYQAWWLHEAFAGRARDSDGVPFALEDPPGAGRQWCGR